MSRLFYHVMQDNLGNLLFGVSGTMRIAGTGTVATIYGDEALTVVLPNPMTNHPSFGSFKCFLGIGDYDFHMAKSGYTFETLTGLQGWGTMAEQNANAVAITGGTAVLSATSPANALAVNGNTNLAGAVGIGTPPVPSNSLTVAFPSHFSASVGIGTAPSTVPNSLIINGPIGIGTNPSPTNSLTVAFPSQFSGAVGIGTTPSGLANSLYVNGPVGIGAVPDAALSLNVAFGAQMAGGNGVSVPDASGNNKVALQSTLNVAGGTGRYFLHSSGTAPSYHLGQLHLGGGPGAPIANYSVFVAWNHSTDHAIVLRPKDSDAGGGNPLLFYNFAGAQIGSISTTGAATAYNTTSDARLKHAIAPLTGALDVVQALNPITHRWRSDDSPGVGFLAHEVAEVVSGVVTGDKDAVDDEGNITPQMMDYSKLVPWLVSAVKELTQQVEMLQAQLAAAGV